jgi:hypothetical protein
MDLVSSTSFQTLVTRHNGEYKVKDFTCWKQFLCMAFGQLTQSGKFKRYIDMFKSEYT